MSDKVAGRSVATIVARYLPALVAAALLLSGGGSAWAQSLAVDPPDLPEAVAAYQAGDHAQALRLWQAACDAGNPRGCYHAGVVHRDGEGVPADFERAKALFTLACEGGFGNACFNMGVYSEGAERIAFFERGCAVRNIGSCARLGMAYRDGEGINSNAETAVRYLERACLVSEMAAGPACFELASIYDAHLSENGNDPESANRWLEEGCARGDTDSCQNLAWHYAHGFGVTTDLVRSAALYQFACWDDAGRECFFVPAAHRASEEYKGREIDRRWRSAAGAYDRACKAGLAHGCFAFARLIARGGNGDRHADRMREMLGKAIALDPDHVAAIELLRRVDAGELPSQPVY